jgi:glutamyl-tRNA reductase
VTSAADGIVALVAHARDVPAPMRQRFADEARAGVEAGGLLLETCHRVEWYLTLPPRSRATTVARALPRAGRRLTGAAAVHHAIAVAAGRDSVVVGEDQVLHQLRQALEAARAARTLEPVLERLFTTAIRAGRRARSWRRAPGRSLADVAVGALEGQVGTLAGREVLIVGAGRIGRLAALAAAAAGASVVVANRSPDRAADVAAAAGARVTDLDPGTSIGGFAGIVVALSGQWPIGPEAVRELALSPSPVVDLSVPLAVPERLADLLGPRLLTADDFARRPASGERPEDRATARLDELIERTAADYLTWLDGRERRAAAQALVELADREREVELAELWRHLPDLDPRARATIEGMSRHLAARLLREPLERLGSDADGRHEEAVRELWAL